MTLEGFKKLNGLTELTFKKSKKTGRQVCMNSPVPLIITKHKDFDATKDLFVTKVTLESGEEVYVVCNQLGWDEGVTL